MSALRYQMRPGYDAGAVTLAIRTNLSRELPRIGALPKAGGSIAICGNGPSLRSCRPESGPIAVLNGAWRLLVAEGRMPDFIIMADPSEENIAWVEDCPVEPIYLVASRVSPKIFDALKGKKVLIWHLEADEEIAAGCQAPMIRGGSTIALKAASLLNFIGYDHFDFYGVDSCFALDGADHAVPQNWNSDQEKIPVDIEGKFFVSCPWMIAQAQEALEQFHIQSRDYTVSAHGDGLFGAFLDHHTLDAVYDLNTAPSSYDFVSWLMNLEAYRREVGFARLRVRFKAGTQDGFRPNELIEIEPQKRRDLLANVCRPALRLFGAEEGGTRENTVTVPYVIFQTSDAYRAGCELPVMEPSREAREWAGSVVGDAEVYTITLRELDAYWPERNSNLAAWIEFAKSLPGRVIFVRDTAKASEQIEGFEISPVAARDLHKRLALYQRAKMNFFVSNGPSVLATYSKAIPYICFQKSPNGYPCHRPDWVEKYMGIRYGGQFPWVSKRQRLIWADDTLENIQNAWREHE